jgi:hypothetical protein
MPCRPRPVTVFAGAATSMVLPTAESLLRKHMTLYLFTVSMGLLIYDTVYFDSVDGLGE